MSAPRLQAQGLRMAFGGLKVTDDVSLSLAPGARTALIGPNGAGKTTLVNLLSGALRPQSGAVFLDGVPVTRLSQDTRVRAGLVRTFQISRLFREMTVLDNVRTAVLHRRGLAARVFQRGAQAQSVLDDTHAALGALGLERIARRIVGTLALGEQRLVEIALALAMRPRVLLLDEPAAGVPQSESGRIFDAIEQLPADLAILLIEHDMDLVFRFARHIVVLAAGALLVEGAPAAIAANDQVKQIYFGRTTHASH
ncbi:ABC transporter ATP-binding protein [Variovorax sp. J31P207]|uniref:ABC transporter ATP-binding protein n=1 Tax=Variovorax sp. J31P207 TaxID=3053510 RepID=UPI0025752A52|nr:ABC transporter ATP-binding protein [Variovorax sp. J31P207]MDM0069705.1 ABC transporter ATP-binding protein [Variovorax sp. J31P207]